MFIHESDRAFLFNLNAQKPTRQPEQLISKWIHGRRIIPPGTPFPGVYNIYKTPYIIELCDNMSPFSTVKHQAIKKGVQIAITTAAENVMAYYIGERPAKQLYISATDKLLEKFSGERLDPLLDSCGLRDLIKTTDENVKSRKTGDKTLYKEYTGGTLALVSAQSPSNLRSLSSQILIRDEIDGAPRLLKTGEGNFLSVSEGRAQGYGDRKKIMDLSTPGLRGESLIDDQYNRGDKRKYFVPCPHCGKEQFLSFGTEKTDYGLKIDTKAGKIVQGYYQCYHCHDAIFDYHKEYMLANGTWRPTAAETAERNFRSYHLPSFYSPPGMTSFTDIAEYYDKAMKEGDDGMRSFTNLYLGKSFEASGEKPKFESVIEIRSTYKSETVPPGMLFLTMAADVQEGKRKYEEFTNDELDELAKKARKEGDTKTLETMPRLDVEVMAHGTEFKTASIVYKQFIGRIDDYTSGAWAKFTEWAKESNLLFKDKNGFSYQVQMIFIDSGDGNYTDVVYNFCETWPNTYAVKGAREKTEDKLHTGNWIDQKSKLNYTRFRMSTSGSHSFILITTNYYKKHIYRNLKNKPCPINGQPANCHITPEDYPDWYFKGLTAEKQKKDGSFVNQSQARNEPLDLCVYNKCAADFYIENEIERRRHYYKTKKGITDKVKLQQICNRKTIEDVIIEQLKKSGWRG